MNSLIYITFINKSDSTNLGFKGLQERYDVEQKRLLMHVCTRWLSIGRCYERLLSNWDPLKYYFNKQHADVEYIL